jgi:hypothetical protein
MSAYGSLKTKYRDRECLLAALKEMGYETVEVHDEAQHLFGYQGDRRAQKANVIVRRQYVSSAANDIGWELQSDGTYLQHISDFDKGKHNTKWLNGLKDHYAEKTIAKEAKKRGLVLKSRRVVNGKKVVTYLKLGV